MQDTFSTVAGFGMDSLGVLICSAVAASIFIWGAWVVGGSFKQSKSDAEVLEIIICLIQVVFIIGMVMWILN